jgi:predicted nucleic acid-binding protein
MSDRFFLDTNVFVCLFDQSAPSKAEISRKLMNVALDSGKGVISYQVVQEFFNVARRRFPEIMRPDQAEQFLSTVLGPLWAIQPSPALYHRALRLLDRYQLHWYDALIVAGAVEAECRILYSEDFQHGQKFEDLVVRSPFL